MADEPSLRELADDIQKLTSVIERLPDDIARTYVRADVDQQVQLRRDAEMTRVFEELRHLRADLTSVKQESQARDDILSAADSNLSNRIGTWSRAILASIIGPIVVGAVLFLLLANRPG